MKITIEGNSEEIKKVLQAISGSEEHEKFIMNPTRKKYFHE